MTSIQKRTKLAAEVRGQWITVTAVERVRQTRLLARPVQAVRFASSDISQLCSASAEQVDAVLRNSNVKIAIKS